MKKTSWESFYKRAKMVIWVNMWQNGCFLMQNDKINSDKRNDKTNEGIWDVFVLFSKKGNYW
jgi:hypothetical protein